MFHACHAEALVKMSRHLSAIQFKESPSYNKLQAWLSELTPADVTRPSRPPAGKRRLSTALPGASAFSLFHPRCNTTEMDQIASRATPASATISYMPGQSGLMSGYQVPVIRVEGKLASDMGK